MWLCRTRSFNKFSSVVIWTLVNLKRSKKIAWLQFLIKGRKTFVPLIPDHLTVAKGRSTTRKSLRFMCTKLARHRRVIQVIFYLCRRPVSIRCAPGARELSFRSHPQSEQLLDLWKMEFDSCEGLSGKRTSVAFVRHAVALRNLPF